MTDQLQKFMFEAAPVRGEVVTLEKTWQEVLVRRGYPVPVRTLLGEMMAAAALLSANIKFDGTLVVQILGDGPVKMLVVQCRSDLSMRATAKLGSEYDTLSDTASLTELVNANGRGRCVITLDPHEKLPGQQPYQGIVPLTNAHDGPLDSVAQVLEHYMRHSEQLDTRLWLAADERRAVGMLLQKLPGDGGIVPRTVQTDADTWDRVCHLGSTLKTDEMLAADPDTLMRRLFWQENVSRFDPAPTRFTCTCSREKVGGMLQMLGRDEIDSILVEQGHVEVHCEFCNQRYAFDAVDAMQLFHGNDRSLNVAATPSQQRH
ncbi:Hsp33 family molecular chaperone HslO [Mycetohabitans endofungorum]|uniref:Hsp33 family molecular chaperone HslO n=1 Tax=Mycetohabitans endofungorum TaxID=417203 RepID=UPI002B055830|nr:Hsp33 family molecular chaperone HslO [Mycetohabitans endofungorum]